MSKTNNFVFKGLLIVVWIIFVGLCIEAGGLIVNFLFSIFNPEIIKNLYQKLNLNQIFEESKMAFYGIYGFILSISIFKAYLFYIVINLMHKMDLTKPFNNFVSEQITKISYFTLTIGILSLIGGKIVNKLQHYGFAVERLNNFWVDSEAYILMGAVIYIIATIFKKGVEIQSENELTI